MIKVKDGYAKLVGTTASGSASHILLSNGSIKAVSDFAMADGTNATGTWNIDISGNAKSSTLSKYLLTGAGTECDANTLAFSDHLLRWYSSIPSTSSNLPTVTGWLNGLLALPLHSNGVTAQLYFSATKALFYRSMASDNWNQIAYTTSDITGNANTASKLQNKVKIWGLDFDGSNDVSGDLLLGASKILGKDSADVVNAGSNHLVLGYGSSEKGWPTYVDGNPTYFRYGASHSVGMFLDSSGKVGIGNTVPQQKLDVSGKIKADALYLTRSNGDVAFTIAEESGTNGYNITASGGSSFIRFYTNSGGSSAVEQMRIHTNGYVGIRTPSPNMPLTINGATWINSGGYINNRATLILNSNNTANNASDIVFKKNSSTAANYGHWAISARYDSTYRFSIFRGVENGSIASEAELFTLRPDGDVDIKGTINLWNTTCTQNHDEGIRLHASSTGWNALVFCGTDNTGDVGTSAKTWGIYTNKNGNIYINKNSSDSLTTSVLCNINNNWGIGTTGPENILDINGIQQIYQRGNDNTAFKNLLLLKQQNSAEDSDQSWTGSNPSFGIGFRRYWSSGSSPYGETTHAGIYATVSSAWKGGLVFRTKNNQTQGGTHDTTALRLRPDGHAIFGNSIETNGSVYINQPSSNRRAGIIGTYDPNRAAAIWSMGPSYQIAADGLSFGNLYGAAYAYFGSGYTFGSDKSGGHSFVWCQNGTPYAALGDYVWALNGFIKNGSSNSYMLLGGGGHKAISDFAAALHDHSRILDAGNSSITTFAYSKAGLSYGEYTWLAGWNGYELRAINKNLFATASHNHNGSYVYTGGMVNGAYAVIPTYNGETGWHRIATIDGGTGYGSWILYLCGNWSWASNTTAILHINTMHTTAKITQVSGIVGFVTDVRLVPISANNYYVDVYVNYSGANTPGTVYCYFLGNGAITTRTTAEKITASVSTAASITLVTGTKTNDNSYAAHFYENSDIRYKTIINNLAIKANQLANLPLFDFKWLDNEDLLNTGTSAQAVQELLPYIVSGTDKLTLDYGVLGTIAGITACKELTEQEKEINELKEQIKFLKDEINNLKTNKLWQS